MPSFRLRRLASCALLVLSSGCASGPYWSREDQGVSEANELRERVSRLEAQLAAAEGEKAALATRATELERDLLRLRQVGQATAAASAAVLEPASLDEATTTGPTPRGGAEIEQSDLDEPGEAPVDSPPPAEGDPRPLYERSLGLLEENQLPEAEAGFRRFLAENPGSDLADNAQFWLAESALRRGDNVSALAGFRAVVETYPDANKVPDALLKVGFCLALLGEPESAATVYRELLERFPNTAAAETARLRLAAP